MADLVFDDVSITYSTRSARGDIRAVKDVSLDIPAGGTLGIAGESGSGKSTLIMAPLRLLPDSATVTGRVLLGGEDVADLSFGQMRALRWDAASIVFQGALHSLNPVRTVAWQIMEALSHHTAKSWQTPEARRARMLDLLASVDLAPEHAKAYPHELSGGQKQRVMIAMALACEPDIIIADEPTTALDVIVQEQVLALLTARVAEAGISLVMISHDLSVLAQVCQRIAVMKDGEVIELGSAQQIATAAHHPYTRALADAFPTIGDPASRMRPARRSAAAAAAEPVEPVEPATPAGEGTAAAAQPADPGSEPPTGPVPDAPSRPAPEAPDAAAPDYATAPVLLEAQGLSVTFSARGRRVSAVDDVDFTVREGEIMALVGQSGSGKTTLARTLLGIQEPDRGTRVTFRGEPIPTRGRALKAFRREVQLVLQDPSGSLNPRLSVYEAVAEGLRIHGMDDEARRVAEALEAAELRPAQDFFESIPQELSGGQRQRVVIAGALALGPRLLVADEPVASLDASVRGEILGLFLDLRARLGLSALIITHDLGLAWNIADTVAVMHSGRIVEKGTVDDVLLHPQHDYTKRLIAAAPSLRPLPEGVATGAEAGGGTGHGPAARGSHAAPARDGR
ncbi:ABC transporter ATP-binding protein [Brevibacterium sp. BRM-1]|uniref:dipeptide ABC transporter ATP-binding protein n=1 Tax=Brevibacterium sp. BRM-1 TaxID=2999062 RepID=UPI002281168B|nr:ABC transporter ATP-binding protein [Brevibacterium sp. BRM-1]WAL40242.1 ABC transporter ATP-binding protein [Brevibacterium sp. BRM-1]